MSRTSTAIAALVVASSASFTLAPAALAEDTSGGSFTPGSTALFAQGGAAWVKETKRMMKAAWDEGTKGKQLKPEEQLKDDDGIKEAWKKFEKQKLTQQGTPPPGQLGFWDAQIAPGYYKNGHLAVRAGSKDETYLTIDGSGTFYTDAYITAKPLGWVKVPKQGGSTGKSGGQSGSGQPTNGNGSGTGQPTGSTPSNPSTGLGNGSQTGNGSGFSNTPAPSSSPSPSSSSSTPSTGSVIPPGNSSSGSGSGSPYGSSSGPSYGGSGGNFGDSSGANGLASLGNPQGSSSSSSGTGSGSSDPLNGSNGSPDAQSGSGTPSAGDPQADPGSGSTSTQNGGEKGDAASADKSKNGAGPTAPLGGGGGGGGSSKKDKEKDGDPTQPDKKAPTLPDKLSDADIQILARIVKGEIPETAGREAAVAVAAVVLNRLKSGNFGKTVAEVAHQPNAFSCYNPNFRAKLYEGAIPKYALDAAKAAAEGENPVPGCTHYFNPYFVHPSWAEKMTFVKRIGTARSTTHDFYRPRVTIAPAPKPPEKS